MLRVIAIVFTDEWPGGDARVYGIALSLKTYLSDIHNACVGLNTSVSPLCILTLALNTLHCAIKISQDILFIKSNYFQPQRSCIGFCGMQI